MINVYEQVAKNKFKSTLIVALFIGFVAGIAYFITRYFDFGPGFLVMAIGFSLFSSLVSYFWGDKIVLGLNRARPAKREEFFDFYTITENLSMAQNIPMPKIYVIDSSAPNAFATGRDPKHAVVAATTGLLSKLNRTELEGVIAHELSHVQNYDIRLMTIVSILIGTMTILIDFASRSMFWRSRDNDDDNNNSSPIFAILGLIIIIFSPIIAQLIQLAISRRREYLADASAVKLTRQPEGLINALRKISSDPNILETASPATESLYISNPFKAKKLTTLFSTHPPIEDRIRVLQEML